MFSKVLICCCLEWFLFYELKGKLDGVCEEFAFTISLLNLFNCIKLSNSERIILRDKRNPIVYIPREKVTRFNLRVEVITKAMGRLRHIMIITFEYCWNDYDIMWTLCGRHDSL